jgi:hypothetical protein
MGMDIAPLLWPCDGIGMVPCCVCEWSIGILEFETWLFGCVGTGMDVRPPC